MALNEDSLQWANDLVVPAKAQGRITKYKALAKSVEKAISDGALKEGDKLPPVRQLAWKLGVTPGTVARAYSVLTDAGHLEAVVGRGTFVSMSPKGDFAPPLYDDAVQHLRGSENGRANLKSPRLPDVGQAHLIQALLADISKAPPSGLMDYPARSNGQKAQLAALHWMKKVPLGAIVPDDIVLTNGGQNAIILVMQAVLHVRRPVILVEDLGYPGFRRAAELLRADVVGVETDGDGLIPEALEAAAMAHDAQLLCTSPEVHNPTCGFTSESRRKAIVEVARRRNFQILDDDCYRVGPSEGPSYRMLAPERGWYVSSISKSVTPALRIGMVVGPRDLAGLARRAAEYSFFGVATPMSDLCAALLSHPQLPALCERVRDDLNRYIQAAVNGLGGFDLVWREDVPFLWLTLPSGWRAGAFTQAAEAQGIQIRAAEEFAQRDERAPHAVRLSINAALALLDFESAIERLRDLLDTPPDQIGV